MFASKDIFLKSSGGYQISRSVRLRASATAYLNRTNSSSVTNNKIFTYSLWVKRGSLGVTSSLLAGDNSTAIHYFGYGNSSAAADTLEFYDGQTAAWKIQTNAVYRDPSAYYHVILSVDTTQATAANRVRIYVNGVECSYATATYPAQNTVPNINVASMPLYIGRRSNASQWYFDGYLTEINFIDGQALTPSSFGETNPTTGVWQPKKYAGTYGTNGFYLNFSDNSNNTATTIGKDYSGNGNNWTPNNISVTAGVTYDSMLDVPTPYADGGNGRGNYAVLNVLSQHASNVTTLSGGNLNVSGNGCLATISMPSGKWYWEATCTSADADQAVGILDIFESNTGAVSGTINPNRGVIYQANTNVRKNGTIVANYATFTNGDVLGLTFDASNNQIAFYKNNTLQGTITADAPTVSYVPHAQTLGGAFSYNFGQRPFTYTPPTGFVALNTQNLPTPTISNGATVMAASTYTGNNGTQAVANTSNGVFFQPDFVWVKNRTNAYTHLLYDSVRGVGTLKAISSSETTAEGGMSDNSTFGYLSALNSNGFTVVSGSTANSYTNSSSNNYIAWQWNAGGSTVTNTSGSISSQVRANATAGFSVVTYTGTAANATVGHGLGVAPSMIITKNRDSATAWWVYHTSLGNTQYLVLNTTAAAVTSSSAWNNTSPTSTVFSLGAANPSNANQDVAYCFAAVAGYSAFGSYTGNGSADGPFVYTGFRPRFVMIKRTDTAGENWLIWDSSRDTYNAGGLNLFPNLSNAENNNAPDFDFLSNGFKLRKSAAQHNASGGTYIFMAFCENPFKLSLAR